MLIARPPCPPAALQDVQLLQVWDYEQKLLLNEFQLDALDVNMRSVNPAARPAPAPGRDASCLAPRYGPRKRARVQVACRARVCVVDIAPPAQVDGALPTDLGALRSAKFMDASAQMCKASQPRACMRSQGQYAGTQ